MSILRFYVAKKGNNKLYYRFWILPKCGYKGSLESNRTIKYCIYVLFYLENKLSLQRIAYPR